MKLHHFIVFSCFLIFGFQSCNVNSCISKSYFLKTYDRFIADMDEHKKSYSEKDWESKDEKITHFVDECYVSFSKEMSVKEKTVFWTKYVQYMINRHGRKTMKAIEAADEESIVDIYDEIGNSIEDMDMEKLLKDVYGDDLENAVDEVLEEINKWGDQLKKWLDSKN